MFTHNKRQIFVPKQAFLAWATVNDPENGIGVELTDDGNGFLIPVSTKTPTILEAIKDVQGALVMNRAGFRTFRENNPTIINEANDRFGNRALPLHPDSPDTFEYDKLFNGDNATLTYNNAGDSEWIFPDTTLNSLDDVIEDDNLIKLPKAKFGEAPIATWEPAFVYVDDVKIFMRTWDITSKVDNGDGTFSIFMAIPPLA